MVMPLAGRGWTFWVLLWGVGVALGGEPVTFMVPTCPSKVYVESGTIIDIRGSVAKGATVLEGKYEPSFESCVQRCCATEDCELSLFKMEGYSETGHNCYLIHCGRVENCLMVSHRGFGSAFREELIMKSDSETEGPTQSSTWLPDRTESGSTKDSPSTTPLTSQPATEPSSATPTLTVTEVTDSTNSSDSNTASEPSYTEPTSPTDTSLAATTTGTVVSDPDHETGSPETGDGDSSSSSPSVATGDEEEDQKEVEEETFDPNDCAKNGCDGRGVIVVVVITCVCILVIVVIAVLVLRKVVRSVRKRRYRNVDYLINGMYT